MSAANGAASGSSAAMRVGVVLLDLGGPERSEEVGPFLDNGSHVRSGLGDRRFFLDHRGLRVFLIHRFFQITPDSAAAAWHEI